jgi:DNA-binding NarL/FixJ family response regulator
MPLIRSALAKALSGKGLRLIGAASHMDDAIRLVLDLRPDVVVIDIGLPDRVGIDTIEQLARLAPSSRILVLTRTEPNGVLEAVVAGASGYILKTAPTDEIIKAIRATAAGEHPLSPEIAGSLLERVREREIPVTTADHEMADEIRATLTTRELDILALLARGDSNQEIGQKLALSPNTVANHVKSILAKLQLHNRVQAAVQAVRTGIIT